MKTKIERRGGELTLRIPGPLAEQLGLQEGEVDVSRHAEELVVRPVPARPSLRQLIAEITDENRHEEIDFGRPVGKEIW